MKKVLLFSLLFLFVINSAPGDFISKWQTTTTNEKVTLPLISGGTYNFNVNWGDGSPVQTITSYSQREHTYSTPGVYTITINGVINGWNFQTTSHSATKIMEINQWGTLKISNTQGVFRGTTNLMTITATDTPDLTGITTLNSLFRESGIVSINKINNWDVSSITSMSYLFYQAESFNSDISNWDVSNVREFNYMFGFTKNFNYNLNNWNTSSVELMNTMFIQSNYNQPIDNWDTSKVTTMEYMFSGATKFNQPIENWNVSNVQTMNSMFSGATSFNQSLNNWNTDKLETVYQIFYGDSNLDQSFSNWKISKMSDMRLMFHNVKLSTKNYDDTLIGWSSQSSIPSGITFSGGTSKYCISANERNTLINTYSWTITDGGFSCEPSDIPFPEFTSPVWEKIYGEVLLTWDYYEFTSYPVVTSTIKFNNNIIYSGTSKNFTWDTKNLPNQEGELLLNVCYSFGTCVNYTITNLEITNFNVILKEPSLPGEYYGKIYYEVEHDSQYPLDCNIYVDGLIVKNTQHLTSKTWSGEINTNGEKVISAGCKLYGFPKFIYSSNTTVEQVLYNLDYIRSLQGYGNVYAYPQNLYYNAEGDLNLLFFSALNGKEYFNVLQVDKNTVKSHKSVELARTMNYMNVFMEDSEDIILLFDISGTKAHFVHYSTNNMNVNTVDFNDFVVVDREEPMEPTQLVNTFSTRAESGFFILGIPKDDTTFRIYKKLYGEDSLEYLNKELYGYSISTSTKGGSFEEWYVAGGSSATNVQLSIYANSFIEVYNDNLGANYFNDNDKKVKVRLTPYHIQITKENTETNSMIIFNLNEVSSKKTFDVEYKGNSPLIYINEDIFTFYTSNYNIEKYNYSTVYNVEKNKYVDIIIIGSGGAGGAFTGGTGLNSGGGGGGGAGGVIYLNNFLLYSGKYDIIINNEVSFDNITAKAGGAGGKGSTGMTGGAGNVGGSGGGGGGASSTGGAGGAGIQPSQPGISGLYGYGNNGCAGYAGGAGGPGGAFGGGGGGGGAGSAGNEGTTYRGGAGGAGIYINNMYIGAGGAGGGYSGSGSDGYGGGEIIIIDKLLEMNFAFICSEFTPNNITCEQYTVEEYGFNLPIDNYQYTAQYIKDNVNTLTFGKTLGGKPLKFTYNENVYDGKFMCLDEMNENNLHFNFTILANDNLINLQQNFIGYVLPSKLIGGGLKDMTVTCENSVQRKYYLGLNNNYLMTFYGLNETKGLYYTLTIKNQLGGPMMDFLISAKRYSPEIKGYVTIEQGVTDSNGNVILFLEPTILYKISVIDKETGKILSELDTIPGSSTSIELMIFPSEHPQYYDQNIMYNDVTWILTPTKSYFNQPTEIEYTVASASSQLEEVGILIKKTNSTGTFTVHEANVQAVTGVTFNYTINEPGSYDLVYLWKLQNHTTYANTFKYQYNVGSQLDSAQKYLSDFGISGWTYYLIALIVATIFIGYFSRYSFTGSAIVGLVILWAFTVFAPADMYIMDNTIGGVGWRMNLYHITSIVTVVLIALLYKRSEI